MKGSIETYRENIFKEGLKRLMFRSKPLRICYDELSNFVYHKQFIHESEQLKDIHNSVSKNDRCFLVATGGSINKTNLDLIKDEYKMGVNSSFKTGLDFDYYLVSDRIMWDVYQDEYLDMDTVLFVGYVAARHYFRDCYNNSPYVLKGKLTRHLPKDFPKYINEFVYTYSQSVTYVALQILFYLGFGEVYLLGCDCDYSTGHFDGKQFVNSSNIQDDVFQENKFWENVFEGYQVCKKVYRNDGRNIFNCTVGGKLEIFERRVLEDVCG